MAQKQNRSATHHIPLVAYIYYPNLIEIDILPHQNSEECLPPLQFKLQHHSFDSYRYHHSSINTALSSSYQTERGRKKVMGVAASKCCSKHFVEPREMRARIFVLEEEMKEIRREKEQKEQVFALERRKQKEEVAMLRRRVEEEEERVRRLEGKEASAAPAAIGGEKWEWRRLEMDCIVEHMREEQARREAAVEKWKQLYLAIKTELDELILRTNEGGEFCWASEQGLVVERMQRELKAKEAGLEALRAKLVAMEREGARKEREIDILRQSLRILNNSKRNRGRRNMKRMLYM